MLGVGVGLDSVASRLVGGAPFVFPSINLASALFDLDATSESSYDGSSQTWANLIAAPADGSAQTAYDFLRGSDNTSQSVDPSFVGSVGARNAEFATDGTQYFTIKNGNTTFIKNMHKTTGGNAWSIVLVGYFKLRSTSINGQWLFGNGGNDGTTKHGIGFGNGTFGTNNKGYLIASGAQGFNGALNFSTAADVFNDTYQFICLTYDPSTKAAKLYVGNNSVITGTASFYASTTDATEAFQLLACGAAAFPAYNGTKLIATSGYNAVLSDANVVTLRGIYSTRHNRTY